MRGDANTAPSEIIPCVGYYDVQDIMEYSLRVIIIRY